MEKHGSFLVMSQGIWKFGDFEMYHNLQVHNRRQQYGYPEPVVWKMYPPEPVVEFRKEVTTRGGKHYGNQKSNGTDCPEYHLYFTGSFCRCTIPDAGSFLSFQ